MIHCIRTHQLKFSYNLNISTSTTSVGDNTCCGVLLLEALFYCGEQGIDGTLEDPPPSPDGPNPPAQV